MDALPSELESLPQRMEAVPPEWPAEVPPPGAPNWELRAVNWLFDQSPAEFRGYAVLRRHPLILAYMAELFVEASNESVARGVSGVRVTLREHGVSQRAIDEAVAVHQREQQRLDRVLRQLRAVSAALRGESWIPRL